MGNRYRGNIRASHECHPNIRRHPGTRIVRDPKMERHPTVASPATAEFRSRSSWPNSTEWKSANMHSTGLIRVSAHRAEAWRDRAPVGYLRERGRVKYGQSFDDRCDRSYQSQDVSFRWCSNIRHVCWPLATMPNRPIFDELWTPSSSRSTEMRKIYTYVIFRPLLLFFIFRSYHCRRIMQRLWNTESMNEVNGMSNVATAMLKHRLCQCGTIEKHLATSCVGRPACDHIEQRLFAAAFRSKNGHYLATVQRQIDTFQNQSRISVAIQASATVHLNAKRHSMRIAISQNIFIFDILTSAVW